MQLTFHQILPEGYIQEVKKSTGVPCGSLKINEQFEKLLSSTMGSELWAEFISKHATSYIHLMNSFEARKREATADHKKSYNIALPFGFIQFFTLQSIEDKFKSTHCSKGLRYSSKLGIIRIDSSLMLQLFAAVVEPMRRHIKREINSLLVSRSVKYAFLVGGFAQSTVLRDRLKLALEPETQLIIAPSPHLAVLHGAALFGLNPEVIRMRRASRTYGIAVFDRFDPRKHPFDAKVVLQNGEKWVCNVFDRFVTVNQPVGLFETITRRYSPVLNSQSFCILKIYSTEQETVTFVTEPGVKQCCELCINFQSDGEGIVNPAIEKLFKREIEVEMLFGQSEIKVSFCKINFK